MRPFFTVVGYTLAWYMNIKLPFLAFVLIIVGLVLAGAAYMRFTLNPIVEIPRDAYEFEREVEIEEEEEAVETPETATPTPTPTPTPEPVEEESAGYTMADVQAHASASSCWTVISGNVYDLTAWISRHPGGRGAITGLCGRDGTSDFEKEHGRDASAKSRLAGFLLGPLE